MQYFFQLIFKEARNVFLAREKDHSTITKTIGETTRILPARTLRSIQFKSHIH